MISLRRIMGLPEPVMLVPHKSFADISLEDAMENYRRIQEGSCKSNSTERLMHAVSAANYYQTVAIAKRLGITADNPLVVGSDRNYAATMEHGYSSVAGIQMARATDYLLHAIRTEVIRKK